MTALVIMVIFLADIFLRLFDTLLEPFLVCNRWVYTVYFVVTGHQLWALLFRLSVIPYPFNLGKTFTALVEKGGRITGLVVFTIPFCSCCACTCLLVCVAQQTAFQDCKALVEV